METKEAAPEQTAVVVSPATPLPAFTGEEMSGAFRAYQDLQRRLDAAMPDQIMSIQGKAFRKKGYWRAIKTSFNLRVECLFEQRINDVGGDWGYEARYRASTPTGAFADGDGACMASEKTVWQARWENRRKIYLRDAEGRRMIDRDRTDEAATVHNVRSHAHTRAFNRAVSNLVGFGEVSAEECVAEMHREADAKPQSSKEALQDEIAGHFQSSDAGPVNPPPAAARPPEPAATPCPSAAPAPAPELDPVLSWQGVPRCPKCGGDMWDNSAERVADAKAQAAGTRDKKPRAAYKCKDCPKTEAGATVWPGKGRATILPAQSAHLRSLMGELACTPEQWKELLMPYGVESGSDLSEHQAAHLAEILEAEIAKRKGQQ